MDHAGVRTSPGMRAVPRELRVGATFSGAAALLGGGGSAIALLMPDGIYAREPEALLQASVAQDIANLFLVAPLLLATSVLAFRGSLRACLSCLGLLGFTVYNYVIYTFSIHLGPLFLVWVAVLGLSVFAFAGVCAGLTRLDCNRLFSRVPTRFAGWYSIVVACLFMALWLSEIVPDIMARRPSTSAAAWALPTNPVHVLDLGLFLPALIASGTLLLLRRPVGYLTAPAALIFIGLTSVPILLTPLVAQSMGADPGWSTVPPVAAILAGSILALYRVLRGVNEPELITPSPPTISVPGDVVRSEVTGANPRETATDAAPGRRTR